MKSRTVHVNRWYAAAALLALASCGGNAESREGSGIAVGDDAETSAGTPAAEEVASPGEGAAEAPAPTPSTSSTSSAPAPRPSSGSGSAPAPAPAPARVLAVPAGTSIPVVMEATLSTRTHKTGDVFHARITEDILAPDGMVLVPSGARLEGKIAEARESSSAEDEALLLLTFDNLLIQGERYPLQAVVTEAVVQSEARDSGARSAATVATGAAAGALVGRILGGDSRGAVRGAVVGAAAGAGVALATRDGHATIEEGARVVVRLEEPTILSER